MTTAKFLEQQIRYHQGLYDDGCPELSDAEFDLLVESLRKLAPSSPVLAEIGKASAGAITKHARPMLSLEKTKTVEDALSWAKDKYPLLVQLKYDGVALSITYKGGKLACAVTRGDGEVGEDVTEHVRFITGHLSSGAHALDGEVRGEAIMPRSVFEKNYAARFANARNLVAGQLGKKKPDPEILGDITFVMYDSDHVKAVAPTIRVHAHRELKLLLEAMHAEPRMIAGDVQDYECDGIVLKCADKKMREELGATSHHPRWAIALKYPNEAKPATVRSIAWQVSRSGTVTPVVELEPTQLDGVTIERATLHHAGRMEDLALGVGSKVMLARRGGVIPHVEERVGPPAVLPFYLPSKCPACSAPLMRERDFLRCRNVGCEEQKILGLVYFAQQLGFLGWGYEMVKQAYEGGAVKTPRDVLYATASELEHAGISPGIASNMSDETHQSDVVDSAKFLAAFGIEALGHSTAKKLIAKYLTVAQVVSEVLDTETLEDVDGIGAAKTRAIVQGVQERANDIIAAMKVVQLSSPAPKTGSGPFAGKKVVFTGSLSDMERPEAQRLVEKYGGEAQSGLTMKTDYLVVGDGAKDEQRTKRDKAAKYAAKGSKIQVIDESAFVRMLAEALEAE